MIFTLKNKKNLSNKKKYIYFLFLVTFLLKAQDYKLNWYTTENGLPQNSIKSIIKDPSGFIWLSTDNGIVRFDGSNLSTINNFVLNNYYFNTFFYKTSKDTIFIANAYNDNILQIKDRKVSLLNDTQRDKLLIYLKPESYNLISGGVFSSSYGSPLKFYMKTKRGNYFINNQELTFKKTNTKKTFSLSNSISTSDFNHFFITNEELLYIDKDAKKAYLYVEEHKIQIDADAVFFDKESKMHWDAVNNHFFVLNHEILYLGSYTNGKLLCRKLMSFKDFKDDFINALYYDAYFDKLYVGTSTHGLGVVSYQKFRAVKQSNYSKDAVEYALLPFDDTSIINPKGVVYNNKGVIKKYSFSNNMGVVIRLCKL